MEFRAAPPLNDSAHADQARSRALYHTFREKILCISFHATRHKLFGVDLRLLHGILREICSLFGHIRIRPEHKLHQRNIGLILHVERDANGHHQWSRRSQIRIRGILTLYAIHPEASLMDRYIIVA
jgi:hypothetical protein